VFARIAQQVLPYMNVAHDAEINSSRRLLLRAAASASESDTSDSSPDRLGGAMELAQDKITAEPESARVATRQEREVAQVRPVALKTSSSVLEPPPNSTPAEPARPLPALNLSLPRQGTVVLDVGGGILVPSLLGKPLRAALESAQEAGIEIDVIGTGVAREQSPPPGSRITAGTRVAVKFSR
jgi:cell division protein FtsI (penicillin-binding protein 3)